MAGVEFGRQQFGEHPFAGSAAAIAAAVTEDSKANYSMVCTDQADVVKCFLPEWGKGRWTQSSNKAPLLELTYPLDDPIAPEFLDFPNMIVLLDTESNIVDRFHIGIQEKGVAADGEAKISLTCYGLLAQLGHGVPISDYSASSKSISSIVADLLGLFQENNKRTAIGLGPIHPDIGNAIRSVDVDTTNPLAVIETLWKTIGGRYFVDPLTRLFHWERYVLAGNQGRQIRLGKDIRNMTVIKDGWAIRTRVKMRGAGGGGKTPLRATATGSTVATFGQITGVFSDSKITNRSDLDDAATAAVAESESPITDFNMSMIDLSKGGNSRLNYDHETVDIDQEVAVIHEQLDASIDTTVTKLVRDLAVPMSIQASFSDPEAGVTAWGGNSPSRTKGGSGIRKSLVEIVAESSTKLKTLSEADQGVNKDTRESYEVTDISDVQTDFPEAQADGVENMARVLTGPGFLSQPIPGRKPQRLFVRLTEGYIPLSEIVADTENAVFLGDEVDGIVNDDGSARADGKTGGRLLTFGTDADDATKKFGNALERLGVMLNAVDADLSAAMQADQEEAQTGIATSMVIVIAEDAHPAHQNIINANTDAWSEMAADTGATGDDKVARDEFLQRYMETLTETISATYTGDLATAQAAMITAIDDAVIGDLIPIKNVDALPVITTEAEKGQIVFWNSSPGDGDDGYWIVRVGETEFQALSLSTVLSGTP